MDTHNVTSSRESLDGPTPFNLQEYQQTSLSGLGLPPASRSPQRDNGEDTTTSDTLPRHGSISSVSAALQSSLESKLRERLPIVSTPGWMIYRMHWKNKVTPRGRQYCQLVASVRPTSGKDSFSELCGWSTPAARDCKDTGNLEKSRYRKDGQERKDTLPRNAWIAGWPTPASRDWKDTGTIPLSKQDGNGGVKAAYLGQTVPLCGWPTPVVNDTTGSTHCYGGTNPDGSRKIFLKTPGAAQMAGWPTPRTETGGPDHSQIRLSGHSGTTNPSGAAKMAGPTRLKPDGTVLTGSTAEMESGGQLNPALSRWLMGYPPEWDDCGVTAMPSSRK